MPKSNRDVQLSAAWLEILGDLFQQPHMQALSEFLRHEKQAGKQIYPPSSQIFAAFSACPPEKVKVVILGQDPYHGQNHGKAQAHGLCFSVQQGQALPPSLQNIYKELASDLPNCPSSQKMQNRTSSGASPSGALLSRASPSGASSSGASPSGASPSGASSSGASPSGALLSGDLSAWAEQGVLLLNSVLTVEAHKAASHAKKGWEEFTDQVIQRLAQRNPGLVFLLWGSYAQKKAACIDESKHYIIRSPHPSPLSAHRGFFGSRPFSRCNNYLKSQNKPEIAW